MVLSFCDYAKISFEEALCGNNFSIMQESIPTTLLTKSLPNAKLFYHTVDFSHSKSDSDYFHNTVMPN